MTEILDLEQRIQALEEEIRKLRDIEAIRSLKYSYWHCLDFRRWEGLEDIFAADAAIDYGFGLKLQGNRNIARGLKLFTERTFSVTVHQGHNPEIELAGPDQASGIWQLDQFGIERRSGIPVHIGLSYADEYARDGDCWRIRRSIVTHTYWQHLKPEEFQDRNAD